MLWIRRFWGVFLATKKDCYFSFFSTQHQLTNICCGYSLEVPQWGTSNEYPQHVFAQKKKQKNMYLISPSYLQLWFTKHNQYFQWSLSPLTIIATEMALFFFNHKILTFFLFLQENVCCGYSMKAPWRAAYNEYPQHMFLCRNTNNISTIVYPLLSGAMSESYYFHFHKKTNTINTNYCYMTYIKTWLILWKIWLILWKSMTEI